MQFLRLDTKQGRPIPNVYRDEQPPGHFAEAARIFAGAHFSVRQRSARATYNCHGMTFANRRTWIEKFDDEGSMDSVIRMILADDDYRMIQKAEAGCGDIVVYKDHKGAITHTGIVVDHNPLTGEINMLSQWGSDGEYFHTLRDVTPTLGHPAEFWTDRK